MARRRKVIWSSGNWHERDALHTSRYGRHMMQQKVRAVRRKTKAFLLKEKYDEAMDVIEAVGWIT